jgi:hypothetical protein
MGRDRQAIVVAAVNAILAIVATYAVLRVCDVFLKDEPDPATVVWSVHIAMFWRLGIGIYVAGMVAFAVFLLARANLVVATRVTMALVPIVGALIALQGVFLP